ncbi:MAG: methyltransferase domain-containing protein [Chitinophagaceae bacterium]|nr:methyltransferase domain-containing protein [Oligoflexus sp.]
MLDKFSQINVTIGDEDFQLYSMKDVYSEFKNHYDNGDGFEEPPLYGILWPSAEGLAWHLWQTQKFALQGKTILELGCGLALPSLLAARLGARVTAMDNHRNFETILDQNRTANKIDCTTAVGSFADNGLKLGTFDFVIGSDILYEPDLYPGLEAFILDHANPGAHIIIADPGRYAAGKFGDRLKTKGRFEKLTISVPSGQIIDLYVCQLI